MVDQESETLKKFSIVRHFRQKAAVIHLYYSFVVQILYFQCRVFRSSMFWSCIFRFAVASFVQILKALLLRRVENQEVVNLYI